MTDAHSIHPQPAAVLCSSDNASRSSSGAPRGLPRGGIMAGVLGEWEWWSEGGGGNVMKVGPGNGFFSLTHPHSQSLAAQARLAVADSLSPHMPSVIQSSAFTDAQARHCDLCEDSRRLQKKVACQHGQADSKCLPVCRACILLGFQARCKEHVLGHMVSRRLCCKFPQLRSQIHDYARC